MKQTLSVTSEEYLGKEQSTVLKGLAALGVLISHTVPACGIFDGTILNPLIASLGYLSVAVFFFLSGYGITAQYYAQKEQYLKSFLKNRVLSTYLLTIFLIPVYVLFRIVADLPIPPLDVLQTLLIGKTIIINGWYLQVVLLFYILWYLTAKFFHKPRAQFAALGVAVLSYMIIGKQFLKLLWVEGSLCFLLGVFWQQNKEKLDTWIFQNRRQFFGAVTTVLGAFCVTFLLGSKLFIPDPFGRILLSVSRCLSTPLFVTFLLLVNISCGKLLNCSVLRFLGKHSMALYVLQGITLHIFKEGALRVDNGLLYIVCVFAGTILLAVVTAPVFRFVTNIPKKYLQRG